MSFIYVSPSKSLCISLFPHTGTTFENLTLLGYYAASSGKRNYHFSSRNNPKSEVLSYFAAEALSYAGNICNNISSNLDFYGEKLSARRPIPRMEDHRFSVVQGCLFNLLTAALHTFWPFFSSATCRRSMPRYGALVTTWHQRTEQRNMSGLCAVFKRPPFVSCSITSLVRGTDHRVRGGGGELIPGHTVHSGLIPSGLAMLADTFIDTKIAYCVVNICRFVVFSQ